MLCFTHEKTNLFSMERMGWWFVHHLMHFSHIIHLPHTHTHTHTPRHRGVPHPETFTTRLHGGKWRSYALSLSGNQLSLYVDCELAGKRRVPLPDYCANDTEVAVTIADSNYVYHEDFGTGIYVSSH